MSSILKALKKVEEEKNARQNVAPLAGDVLKSRRGRQPEQRWKIPAALAAVAVVAVLGTYAAMGGLSAAKPVAPPAQVVAPASKDKVSAPITVQIPSESFPADGAPAVTAEKTPLVQKPQAVPAPMRTQVQPIQSGRPTVSPLAKPASAPSGRLAPIAPAVAVRRQAEAVLRTTTGSVAIRDSHVEFKVNGIAWQKESSSRLAVVNGVAVTQGSSIDGAKVVEILPDRVRLLQGNRTFEIYLGNVNQYR